MLCLGGAGHLSCVGNFAPDPVAQLYDAFVAGDHERARALHYDLHPLVDAAFAETNPVPVKWVMEQLGLLASDHAREPLAPLSDAGREKVRALLATSPHVDLDAPVSAPAYARSAARGGFEPRRRVWPRGSITRSRGIEPLRDGPVVARQPPPAARAASRAAAAAHAARRGPRAPARWP